MITIRKAAARGRTQLGWLDSKHSFSFGQYRDPAQMGFRDLRVINEDVVAPGAGFDTHGHRDMEILTYVVQGALAHKDSLGTGSTIARGEVQVMSAGTGIRHSEFNASRDEPVHFLQIWMLPERQGLAPRYDQRRFDLASSSGRLQCIASGDGREDSVRVAQDLALHAGILNPGEPTGIPIAAGRHAWVQVVSGAISLDGHSLAAGDGAAVSQATTVMLRADREAEVLVFDLA